MKNILILSLLFAIIPASAFGTSTFQETFELELSGNYDNSGVVEEPGTGTTIDPDEATTTGDLTVPTCFGDEWMQFLAPDDEQNNIYNNSGVTEVSEGYISLYFIIDSDSLTSGEEHTIFGASADAWNYIFNIRLYENGSLQLRTDSTQLDITSAGSIVDDTLYQVEVYFDAVSDDWEWKINGGTFDGSSEGSGTGTMGPGASGIGTFIIGDNSNARGANWYADNVNLETGDWAGDWAGCFSAGSAGRRRLIIQ